MTPDLILSIFPGLDMIGHAFEAEGYYVVRGPDVIMGQEGKPVPGEVRTGRSEKHDNG